MVSWPLMSWLARRQLARLVVGNNMPWEPACLGFGVLPDMIPGGRRRCCTGQRRRHDEDAVGFLPSRAAFERRFRLGLARPLSPLVAPSEQHVSDAARNRILGPAQPLSRPRHLARRASFGPKLPRSPDAPAAQDNEAWTWNFFKAIPFFAEQSCV